jgi:hypothetical protein
MLEMMMNNQNTETTMETTNTIETKRAAVQAKIKALKFGTEIEFTGISREAAARAVLSVVGGEITPHNWMQVTAPDGRVWKIVSDGSVTGSGFNNGGEFVSPILTWDDMDLLQNVIRALRAAGARVDDTCGQHVHVGAEDIKADVGKLRDLVAFAYRWEAPMMAAAAILPRRLNYCAQVSTERYNRFMDRRIGSERTARVAWYGAGRTSNVSHYDQSRYCWLNVHAFFEKTTIEFRMWNATLHAGKAKANIIASLAVMAKVLVSRSVSFKHRSGGADRLPATSKFINKLLGSKLCLVTEEFKNVRKHLTGAEVA